MHIRHTHMRPHKYTQLHAHICMQVEYASEGGKRSSCLINVRMPEGDTVRVDEVDASGQTIDVDFREIS